MKKLIFIALLFYTTGLYAQFKRPFFNTITLENGLPEALVMTSLQDRLGYLWFGTQNGVVRYDGYSCTSVPVLDDNGKPLYAVSVRNLFEDKQGNLWTALFNKGDFVYNRQRNVFEKPKTTNAAMSRLLKNDFVKFIYERKNNLELGMKYNNKIDNWVIWMMDLAHGTVDSFSSANKGRQMIPAGNGYADIMIDSSGNSWLATGGLLSIYDKKSQSFKPYFQLPPAMNKILFNYIAQDPINKDQVWISTFSLDSSSEADKTRIIRVNIKTKEYKTYGHTASDPNSIAGTCDKIYVDSLKRVFFYTEHGISMYNRATDKFINYNLPVPGLTAKEVIPITSITTDMEGNLWAGGTFKGLFFLNTATGATTFYYHTDEPGSLPEFNSGISKVFVDRSGVLWVNMPFTGLAWLDQGRSFFNPVKINIRDEEDEKNNGTTTYNIEGLYSDSVFIVADNNKVFTWNHITNAYKILNTGTVKINSAFTDKEGLVWMTTIGSGLYCYNPVTKTIKNYRNNPKDSTTIGDNKISCIAEDNKGNIWIGTFDNGLNSFNKKTGKFTRYPFIFNNGIIKANNVLDDAQVNSLLCGKDGIVWIGTNLGSLNRFDPQKGTFISYLDTKEASNYSIRSLYQDSQDRLWAGSYLTGFFLANKDSGFSKQFTDRDGLPSNDIRGITEDKKGNIWLATSHGLSRIVTTTSKITNYTTINGLPVTRTSGIYKDSKGLLYVFIKNGMIPFDPDNMVENKIPPEVVIESIKYHTATANRDTVLFTEGLRQLSLKYNENRISFQNVALHFSNALLNQYAYQLEGYDKNWITAGTERSVTYTNLSPGTYTFKVKAANSDAVWNETGAHFTFTILPPWWKTWWAYSLYAIALLAAVFSFIAYRSAALKKENKILEEKVELRTAQLQSSIADLKATQSQLIQSEKMASLGELTAGIAHEIQNPLNFVNNFSEVSRELIDELKSQKEKLKKEEQEEILNDIDANLEKINHHGQRAAAIVKGMLQHSRQSSGKKEPTDINALADEYLRLAYHGLRAKDKSFNAAFETNFDPTLPKLNVIPQDLGRVLLNIINNAFYAVNEKKKSTELSATSYEPLITVQTKKVNDKVEVIVTDNGNGIPQNIIDKIFQPFFTTKPTGQGTGLGLSLAYDIVKAHGGELKVETKEREGTTFIIQLPAG
ncbi:MAG: GHKL domain-containing protein [Chitinophagaceae bacterium]|nr:GHKL domain-containing protein [Chitinophagaceae bacterium]